MTDIGEADLCRMVEIELAERLKCRAEPQWRGSEIRYVCSHLETGVQHWQGEYCKNEETAWNAWLLHIALERGVPLDYPDLQSEMP